jgi:hypothetical protein
VRDLAHAADPTSPEFIKRGPSPGGGARAAHKDHIGVFIYDPIF